MLAPPGRVRHRVIATRVLRVSTVPAARRHRCGPRAQEARWAHGPTRRHRRRRHRRPRGAARAPEARRRPAADQRPHRHPPSHLPRALGRRALRRRSGAPLRLAVHRARPRRRLDPGHARGRAAGGPGAHHPGRTAGPLRRAAARAGRAAAGRRARRADVRRAARRRRRPRRARGPGSRPAPRRRLRGGHGCRLDAAALRAGADDGGIRTAAGARPPDRARHPGVRAARHLRRRGQCRGGGPARSGRRAAACRHVRPGVRRRPAVARARGAARRRPGGGAAAARGPRGRRAARHRRRVHPRRPVQPRARRRARLGGRRHDEPPDQARRPHRAAGGRRGGRHRSATSPDPRRPSIRTVRSCAGSCSRAPTRSSSSAGAARPRARRPRRSSCGGRRTRSPAATWRPISPASGLRSPREPRAGASCDAPAGRMLSRSGRRRVRPTGRGSRWSGTAG